MTQPGLEQAPQPGWWVRSDYSGANLTAGFGWASNPAGAMSPAGQGSGAYGWSTVDTLGFNQPPPITGINASTTTSVTIPTHAVGNLIIIFAYDSGATTAPAPPAAGGTVPAWGSIDSTSGANVNASGTWSFVATATNHTSGTWTSTSAMIAVVLSGQAASPIGGHTEAGSTANGSSTAPAVTMTNTDGSSQLLHFFGYNGAITWSAAPTGYTQQISNSLVCCDTKTVTTSDGSVTQANSGGFTVGYRGATVEIRRH